ncbi:MAG: inosine monophosphate cyclohydrolase [Erysipelotrichaceae bacterium]|nr:inosine monophosphate cyclohydrolase [Erysipelotrichaceae bacterium]
MELFEYLKNNAYPGRGIAIGKYNDEIVIAYFIMGRSPNSRNRVFRKKKDILFTKAYDESQIADPTLIIYNAIREYEGSVIVTNGNQTDTIYRHLSGNSTFEAALDEREYEPDAPNYTPRISAIINNDEYKISILKRKDKECERLYYTYKAQNNTGHFISTYDHDGDPLPSFSSEPLEFKIEDNFVEFSHKLWASLNKDNKISLYVRFGNDEIIFNKNEE